MKVRYNVRGTDRQRLAFVLSDITGNPVKYRGIPIAAYDIGGISVDRYGVADFGDMEKSLAERIVRRVSEAGFDPVAELAGGAWEEFGAPITLRFPPGRVDADKLRRILAAQGGLIRKSLGLAALPTEMTESGVAFTWFSTGTPVEVRDAGTELIIALCRMSLACRRFPAWEKRPQNEKYAFRQFLLALGMSGKSNKKLRSVLLRNLKGDCTHKIPWRPKARPGDSAAAPGPGAV